MFEHGFPKHWSTLKKFVWLIGSGVIGGASAVWKTVTGTLIHITDALASPMQKCEVTLEPIQAGSGDPSPDNVRPITGWTGCEVNAKGINLWNESYFSPKSGINSSGAIVSNNDRAVLGTADHKIPVKPSTTYYVKFPSTTNSLYLAYFDRSGVFISPRIFVNDASRTFTTPDNAYYLLVSVPYSSETYGNDVSLNFPSTDTDYHAYSGTTLSVTFPDTVYGGKYEFVSGKLVNSAYYGAVTGGVRILDNTYIGQVNTRFYIVLSHPLISGNRYAICDMLPILAYDGLEILHFRIPNSVTGIEYGVDDSQSAITKINSYLSGNPMHICYLSSDTTETQLTPQEISTLQGENNVWSNGDSVEITYKAQAE